nr:AMP-binding protein [Amycolatopsis sp. MtRt-6]
MTYAELDDMARRLATGLARLGVDPGDVVAVQLPNGRLACAADLAIAALGAVSLPYPVGRGQRDAASLLARSGAVAVVTVVRHGDYGCAEGIRTLAAELPELRASSRSAPKPRGAASRSTPCWRRTRSASGRSASTRAQPRASSSRPAPRPSRRWSPTRTTRSRAAGAP